MATENKSKEKPLPMEVFDNGDTRKQLLARSRYLLYKSQEKWISVKIWGEVLNLRKFIIDERRYVTLFFARRFVNLF